MNFPIGIGIWGAGTHRAAWRFPSSMLPYSAEFWRSLVQLDHPQLSFISLNDLFLKSQHNDYSGTENPLALGQLDPLILSAWLAPQFRYTSLIPSVNILHTEPFHTAKSSASIDFISHGKFGIELIAAPEVESHFGRRPELNNQIDFSAELQEYAQVLRLLWDSWEDDAEIRDSHSGKFIDRTKLHYINFVGKFFSVKGPSITPRSPQGHPLIFSELAGEIGIDFFFGTAAQQEPKHMVIELEVYLDTPQESGATRKAALDYLDDQPTGYLPAGYSVFTGSISQLYESIISYQQAGYAGIRLHPGVVSNDVPIIVQELLPLLEKNPLVVREDIYRSHDATSAIPVLRESPYENTLRAQFGLARPENHFNLHKHLVESER